MKPRHLIDLTPVEQLLARGAVVSNHLELSADGVTEKLCQLHEQAEEIQARADREDRALTEAEEAQIKRIYDRFRGYEAELETFKTQGRKTQDGQPGQPWHAGQPVGDSHNPQPRLGQTGATAAQRFNAMMRDTAHDAGGFNSLGDFMSAIASAREDSRLRSFRPRAQMEEGTGSSGGYLVPPAFMALILGPMFASSGILSRVNLLPMASNVVAVAGFNMTDNSSGAIGGLELLWEGEGDTLPGQTGVLKQLNLRAKKGAILVQASNELLEDSAAASTQLQEIMRNAAQFGLERAVLAGDGVGRPRGILNDPALVVVPKESGQSADTIVFENTIKMLARMHPSLLPAAQWIASPTILPQLLSMAFPVRDSSAEVVAGAQVPTRGDGEPVGTYRLHGLPLTLSEALPTVGDQGDLLLVAGSEYLLGMRKDVQIEMSPHLKFDSDQSVFRLRLRVDGQGRWDQAAQPLNGNSLSWCVALAARA